MSARSRKKRRTMASWGFYGTPAWRKLRKRVIAKYGRRCMRCGLTPWRVHVDHIKPKSKFPALALAFGNLQILCRACNYAKAAHDFTDWRR